MNELLATKMITDISGWYLTFRLTYYFIFQLRNNLTIKYIRIAIHIVTAMQFLIFFFVDRSEKKKKIEVAAILFMGYVFLVYKIRC